MFNIHFMKKNIYLSKVFTENFLLNFWILKGILLQFLFINLTVQILSQIQNSTDIQAILSEKVMFGMTGDHSLLSLI